MSKQMFITTKPPGFTGSKADAVNVSKLDRTRSTYASAQVAEKQAQSGDWTERTRAEQTTRSARRDLECAELEARTQTATRKLDAGNVAPSYIRSDCGTALLLVNAPVCSQKRAAVLAAVAPAQEFAATVPYHKN